MHPFFGPRMKIAALISLAPPADAPTRWRERVGIRRLLSPTAFACRVDGDTSLESARCHAASWWTASRRSHAPTSTMWPLSSSIGMNAAGETVPNTA